MPPQVGSAREGTRPVVTQTPEGVEQTKSSDVEKKTIEQKNLARGIPTEQQKNLSDCSATQTHRASPEEKTGKLKELSVRGDWTKATLDSKLKELDTEGTKSFKSPKRLEERMSIQDQGNKIKQEAQMQSDLRQIRADTQKNMSRKD